MKLSAHFDTEEFQSADFIPTELLPIFTAMCLKLLEPIREKFNRPIRITSGYRSPTHNAAVGGVPTSQHVATLEHCACDFQMPGGLLNDVFDWIRLDSFLAFDQVILERGKQPRHGNDDCIHISYTWNPRREALKGSTHGQGEYVVAEVNHRPAIPSPPEIWGEA